MINVAQMKKAQWSGGRKPSTEMPDSFGKIFYSIHQIIIEIKKFLGIKKLLNENQAPPNPLHLN